MGMKRVSIVIGSNFGDEGKGAMVSELVSRYTKATAVVRFNGGAQAGHTVVNAHGQRHVFHQIGAGTFHGASTILGDQCLVDPVVFNIEADTLCEQFNLTPHVYVANNAFVVTPFDVAINWAIERARGNDRHGSCGMGISEAVERSTNPINGTTHPIFASDLTLPVPMIEKLLAYVANVYVPARCAALGLQIHQVMDILPMPIDRWAQHAAWFAQRVKVEPTRKSLERYTNLVFEGAQGLGLDQKLGHFPHVTRSYTGLKNVSPLIQDIDSTPDVYYMTRCYMTRHGAGPLADESSTPYPVDDLTNIPNEFQGTLRFAPLSSQHIIARAQRIWRDRSNLAFRKHRVVNVITCCDQYERVPAKHRGAGLYEVINGIQRSIPESDVMTTWGPQYEHSIESVAV